MELFEEQIDEFDGENLIKQEHEDANENLSSQENSHVEEEEERNYIEIPNKQESLFCCGRKGPNFYVIYGMQLMYVLLVAYFGYKLGMILIDEVIGMALGFVGYILGCLTFFWLLPSMFDAFVLTSSLEMLRNRECVDLVLREMRFDRAKNTFRVYQILKLIRREIVIEYRRDVPDKEMNDKMLKHVRESFQAVHEPDSAAQKRDRSVPIVRNEKLFTLARMTAGAQAMNREECFILLKKIHLLQRVEAKVSDSSSDKQNSGVDKQQLPISPLAFI